MINDDATVDDNAESGADAPPSESLAPAARSAERSKGVVLNRTSYLLVQRSPSAADPEVIERVLVAASQQGLGCFESLDDISHIWFVRWAKEGTLQTERVMHLCYWRLIPDHDGSCLTALLCESGALLIADAEDVYEVDETTRQWFAGGKFRAAGNRRPAERGHSSASEHASTSQRTSVQAGHG